MRTLSIFVTVILQLNEYLQQGFDFFGNPEPLGYILNKHYTTNDLPPGYPNGWSVNPQNQQLQMDYIPVPSSRQSMPSISNLGTTTTMVPSTETTPPSNSFVIPGLDGTECVDLYAACPEFAENDYCVKYRTQMMIQCRKSCKFCDLDPYEENPESSEESSGSDLNSSGDSEDTEEDKKKEDSDSEEDSSLNDEERADDNSENKKRNDIPASKNVDDSPKNIGESPESTRNDLPSEDQLQKIPIENPHLQKLVNVIRKRFMIPGATAYSEDIYAETGIDPLSKDVNDVNPGLLKNQLKQRNVKKSEIILRSSDPYEYVKNMDKTSSMFPLSDDSLASLSLSSRSFPVHIFKQPGDTESVKTFLSESKRSRIPKPQKKSEQQPKVSNVVRYRKNDKSYPEYPNYRQKRSLSESSNISFETLKPVTNLSSEIFNNSLSDVLTYQFFDIPETQRNAEIKCKSLNFILPVIKGNLENKYFNNLFDEPTWLDLKLRSDSQKNQKKRRKWIWSDGSPPIYSNWYSDESSSLNIGADCVIMELSTNRSISEPKWMDVQCDRNYSFSCSSLETVEECNSRSNVISVNFNESHCYCIIFISQYRTWRDSFKTCNQLSMKLPKIWDESSLKLYEYTMKNNSVSKMWLGLNDIESEDKWVWSDGSPVTFEAWKTTYPRNNNHECSYMREDGLWMQNNCSQELPFYCVVSDYTKIFDSISAQVKPKLSSESLMFQNLSTDISISDKLNFAPVGDFRTYKLGNRKYFGNAACQTFGNVSFDQNGNLQISIGTGYLECEVGEIVCNSKTILEKEFSIAFHMDMSNISNDVTFDLFRCSTSTNSLAIIFDHQSLLIVVIDNRYRYEKGFTLSPSNWTEIFIVFRMLENRILVYQNFKLRKMYHSSTERSEKDDGLFKNKTSLVIGSAIPQNSSKGTLRINRVIYSQNKWHQLLVQNPFAFNDFATPTLQWILNSENLLTRSPNSLLNLEYFGVIPNFEDGVSISFANSKINAKVNSWCLASYEGCPSGAGFGFMMKISKLEAFEDVHKQYFAHLKVKYYVKILSMDKSIIENCVVPGLEITHDGEYLYFEITRVVKNYTLTWNEKLGLSMIDAQDWISIVVSWSFQIGMVIVVNGNIVAHILQPQTSLSQCFYTSDKIVFGNSELTSYLITSLCCITSFNHFVGILQSRRLYDIKHRGAEIVKKYQEFEIRERIVRNPQEKFGLHPNEVLKTYLSLSPFDSYAINLDCDEPCKLEILRPEGVKSSEFQFKGNKKILLQNATTLDLSISTQQENVLRMFFDNFSNFKTVPVTILDHLYYNSSDDDKMFHGVLYEVWDSIASENISDLIQNEAYPYHPRSQMILTNFEAPQKYSDYFASRISGFFRCQESGFYRFFVSTDNSADLWISVSPQSVDRVAYCKQRTKIRSYNENETQKSKEIFMEANKFYPMMTIHQAGHSEDHLSVAMIGPKDVLPELIPSSYLYWNINYPPIPKNVVKAMKKLRSLKNNYNDHIKP